MKTSLLEFLKENENVFTWTVADMLGIDPRVISNHLNVDPTYKPIRQKKRLFKIKRQKAIDKEVNKLINANFIREV